MLFTSLTFLLFFVLVFSVHWILPARYRWILLLVASLVFYGFGIPQYTPILVLSALMNYGFGLWIARAGDDRRRRNRLVWGIVLNIALLGMFKVFSVHPLFTVPASWGVTLAGTAGWILPLGISFFTFANLSYLIEIKRRKWEPERHLGYFAVYVTFFPKLIQGPIERPAAFLPQVKTPAAFNYDRAVGGLRLLLWGFFKKLVIADRLALAVNPVFERPDDFGGPAVIVAAILYSIQIYADFSGYIDIARGCAKLLGFELTSNFNRPYAATSVKDFWSRWHISLSNWLRDYVFLPLAFDISRRLKKERYLGMRTDHLIYSFAITVTFLLCGIWHGAGFTFLVWGALYALYLVTGRLTEKPKRRLYRKAGIQLASRLYRYPQVIVTFTLVTFAWVLFRSTGFQNFSDILTAAVRGWSEFAASPASAYRQLVVAGFTLADMVIIAATVPFLFLTESSRFLDGTWQRLKTRQTWLRWSLYYSVLITILLFGKFENSTFIYYQF